MNPPSYKSASSSRAPSSENGDSYDESALRSIMKKNVILYHPYNIIKNIGENASCSSAGYASRYRVTPKSKKIIQTDDKGNIRCENGEILQDRYTILSTLGEGTFGKVIKVHDDETNQIMAIKIIRNIAMYRYFSKTEIDTLKYLNELPSEYQKLFVKMHDWFDFHGHVCIVFEILGSSVYDFLEGNDFEPYDFDQTREISYQIIHAVKVLHENHITHTDLKPENILFENSTYKTITSSNGSDYRRVIDTRIRIVDFGGATFDHEYHGKTVSTRHYRAPEVILENGWTHPMDVWSIGCIMLELYLGYPVFDADDDLHHLAQMERVLGRIPQSLIKSSKTNFYTNGVLNPHDQFTIHESYSALQCYNNDPKNRKHQMFFDLIEKMLTFDPDRRITLSEAMEHPLFADLPSHMKISANKNCKQF